MNKKKITFIIVIVLIGIVLAITYHFKNRRVYELNLPKLEKIESILLQQNENKKVVSNNKEMKEILDAINGLKRITQEQSTQEVPVNIKNEIKIDFNFKESEVSTIFVYQNNNKYYLEQPYNGIYKISKDEYDLILNYVIEANSMNEEYYKSKLEELPKEISIQEVVRRGYFVYDDANDKIYNKNVLDRFVKNTEINATNRVEDEIIIVIYTINEEPTIYNILYTEKGYILVKDATRIETMEMEIISKEYYEITVNSDIPKEYYGITVKEDEGVNAVSISLTVYKNDINEKQYEDIEIARYLLNAEIVKE